MKRELPRTLAQIRTQLGWMEQRLGAGRDFMLGGQPGLPDALCYYLIWFIRGRYAGGPEFLNQFSNLIAWEERVRAIGHGQPTDMTALEALQIARTAKPETNMSVDPQDPEGLETGMRVAIAPDDIGGGPSVEGTIACLNADEIAVRRTDPRVDEVVVHFPRVGFRVSGPNSQSTT
jgi:glutathione S-transferase